MSVYALHNPEAARLWVESAREASAEDAENAMTWIGNILGGAGTGAATGAVGGPIGALIGAVVGAGVGAAQTALSQQQQRPAQRPPQRPARPAPPPRPAARPAPPPHPAARPAQPQPAPAPAPLRFIQDFMRNASPQDFMRIAGIQGPVGISSAPAPAPAVPAPPAAQSDLSNVLGAVLTLLPVVVSAFGQRQAEAIDEIDSVLPDYSLEQAVEAAVLEALESAESGDLGLDTQPVRERLPEVVTALTSVLPSVLLSMEPASAEARYAEWEWEGEGEFIPEGDESPAESDDEQWTTPEWEAEATA